MVEWLAGNRIRGTSAEKPVLGLQSPSVGGWVEVGRTTLGSANADILVSSLPDKRYYMILYADKGQASNGADVNIRLNGDTGSNYSYRRCGNGGTDATDVSTSTSYGIWAGSAVQTPIFGVFYLANKSDKEKLWQGNAVTQHTAGAGNDPERAELVTKWANTSSVVSSITAHGTSNLASGSEVVVLGWDPADTHTTNFWEELASVDLSGGAATNIDSGTITAKKYLWCQLYTEQSIDSDYLLTFNADSGSNYCRRYSNDGGGDGLNTSRAYFDITSYPANLPMFMNFFIINNSANEKLIIAHHAYQNTAGAGTAPHRSETVGKWINTSAQITAMNIKSGSGNLASKTVLKIWGSD